MPQMRLPIFQRAVHGIAPGLTGGATVPGESSPNHSSRNVSFATNAVAFWAHRPWELRLPKTERPAVWIGWRLRST